MFGLREEGLVIGRVGVKAMGASSHQLPNSPTKVLRYSNKTLLLVSSQNSDNKLNVVVVQTTEGGEPRGGGCGVK